MQYLYQMNKTFFVAFLILLSFLLNWDARADEIGPSTCGKSILVRGDINHYTNESGYTVVNATDDDMYSEEVYGKDFTAVVEDLPQGTYTLEIYMAESYHKAAGLRRFSIYEGSTLIVQNLDIYAEAGADTEYKFNHSVDYDPAESDNELSIRFLASTDNAKFNAIRIFDDSDSPVACVIASELTIIPEAGTGNPFVWHIFTADPSAHVFEDKMYVYPSHDLDNAQGFNMRDYHVFSSSDLSDWEDHGVVLDVDDVPWATEYMWAPDCAYKNGMYYFYFPAKDSQGEFRIGVATSPSPAGPFIPEPEPIEGSFSVDPCVFIDDDGETYMYFGGDGDGGQNTPWVAKLDSSMKEFSEAPQALTDIDYWFEACWVHKLEDTYYMSYSTGSYHPQYPSSSAIAWATATHPMGPFTYQGIVNGYVSGWTNHHSAVEYKGQWYFFYHTSDLSGGNTTKRSVCAEYLHFSDDGSIREVVQTKRGIGSYNGLDRIEAENYSETGGAQKNANIGGGLHMSFNVDDTLIFNNIDFGEEIVNTVQLRLTSDSDDGTLSIWTDTGEVLGSLKVENTGDLQNWQSLSAQIQEISGKQNIYLVFNGEIGDRLYLDWIEFSDSTTTLINQKSNIRVNGLYPNPVVDFLQIENAQELGRIEMINALGALVFVANEGVNRIDMSHLEAGIYFIRFYTGDQIAGVHKVIKE